MHVAGVTDTKGDDRRTLGVRGAINYKDCYEYFYYYHYIILIAIIIVIFIFIFIIIIIIFIILQWNGVLAGRCLCYTNTYCISPITRIWFYEVLLKNIKNIYNIICFSINTFKLLKECLDLLFYENNTCWIAPILSQF